MPELYLTGHGVELVERVVTFRRGRRFAAFAAIARPWFAFLIPFKFRFECVTLFLCSPQLINQTIKSRCLVPHRGNSDRQLLLGHWFLSVGQCFSTLQHSIK